MNQTDSSTSPLLHLGTSSWSSKDWVGKVYAEGTPANEFITQYAQRFRVVEIDATFYATPRRSTVRGWRDRTPEGFLFAAKVPKTITHEKTLVDCEDELREFVETISLLGDRLGPLLLQFPYFARKRGYTFEGFFERLAAFLPTLPGDDARFAVEIRNKTWLRPDLLDLLTKHQIPLAFIDHPWMPRPAQLFAIEGIRTGPFAYIRWLGDRHGIEKITKKWDQTVVDRTGDLGQWVEPVKKLLDDDQPVFGFFNNHYSGHAPADVELLRELLMR